MTMHRTTPKGFLQPMRSFARSADCDRLNDMSLGKANRTEFEANVGFVDTGRVQFARRQNACKLIGVYPGIFCKPKPNPYLTVMGG